MRVVATCIVISALLHYILATPIVGEGGSAVRFTGTQDRSAWGEIDGAVGARGSWTMELWFMASNLNNMPFKPIISQYTAGDQNNRFTGFDLQIWPNGQLCFFMGNGTVNTQGYGVFWFDTDLEHAIVAGEWYHIAVVFSTNAGSVSPYTPERISIYVDGELRGTSLWNGGSRQSASQPIRIGRFDNQDPGVQSFAGVVDDIRIWDHARTQEDITSSYYLNRRLESDEEGLLAYFTFDERTATMEDVTGKYTGLLSTPAGGESFTFEWSPIPLHTWETAYNNVTHIITLEAESSTDSALYFSINQLPTKGKLYVVDAQGRIRDRITLVNVANLLPTDQVAYLPDTPSFVNDYDLFTYYANDGVLSEEGIVHIYVLPGEAVPGEGGCDGLGGVIDECGVCNGNGLNCTCVGDTYRSYTLAELDRILVHYNIEYTLDLIHALETTLDETLDKLYSTNPNMTPVDLAAAVEVVQEFNSQCLSEFKDDMEDFLDELMNNRQY